MSKIDYTKNKTFEVKALSGLQSIDEKNYTIDFVMTAQVEDRQGDVVDVDTIKLDNFLLNPIVIPSHDYDQKAVGKVVEIRREVVNGVYAMVGKVKFAYGETDEATEYWNLYSKGYQSAVSIGFRVGRTDFNHDTGITTLYDCELIELSLVAVPANQLALAKTYGMSVSAIVKSIPQHKLNEELKTLLIGVKDILNTEEENSENINTVKEKNIFRNKEFVRMQKLKNLFNQAIRELNKETT